MPAAKVLFITYEYGDGIAGGIGRVVNGLAMALHKQIDFGVFLMGWKPKFYKYSGDLYIQGKQKIPLTSDYISEIKRLIDKSGYNVIHISHASEHTHQLLKSLRESKLKIRVVFSVHSIAKFEISIRNNAQADLVHEDYILHNCDCIHVLSETSRQWLYQVYPKLQQQARIHIIPNAIDCGDSAALPQPSDPTGKTILCISRWSFGKGIEYLIEAIPQVINQVPDAKFIIAGRKEVSWENDVATYVQGIDSQIAALDSTVKEKIAVLGWVDDAEKALLFADAAMIVMPSEIEYFPYSILEPASKKLPIISSRISGVEDLLHEGRDCLMFEPKRGDELATKIVQLLLDRDLAKNLGESAYDQVKNNFSWDKVSDAYCELYVHVAATNHNGSGSWPIPRVVSGFVRKIFKP